MMKIIKYVFFALLAAALSVIMSILTILATMFGQFAFLESFSLESLSRHSPHLLREAFQYSSSFTIEFLYSHSPLVSFMFFWSLIMWGVIIFAIFFPYFRKFLLRLLAPFAELARLLRDFYHEHKIVVLFAIVLFFLCYGFEIANPTLSIDEEFAFCGVQSPLTWLGQGRLGIAIYKSFFQFHNLPPLFLSSFISAALWMLSALLWCVVIHALKTGGKCLNENISAKKGRQSDALSYIIFCGIYMSSPLVIAEFMMFATYNVEVSLAMVFSVVSAYSIATYNINGKKMYFFSALLPLTFAISVYQSFVVVFITGTVAVLLLSLSRNKKSDSADLIKWMRTIPPYIFALLISIIAYYALLHASLAVTNASLSGYTDNIIGWGQGEPLFAKISNVMTYIIWRHFSPSNPGAIGSWLTLFALTFLAILCFVCYKGIKRLIMPLLCGLLYLSAFTMQFSLMSPIVPLRAMQALPLMAGFAWLLLYEVIRQLTASRAAVLIPCIVSFLLIFGQIQLLNRLFYGDHVRYQMDRQLAAMIMHDVREEFSEISNERFMFVGTYHHPPNPAVIRLEVIGGSFWNWDSGRSNRMGYFLRTEGYDIRQLSMDNQLIDEYRDIMPIWPSPGSIIRTDDGIIIVRLS